LDAEISFSVQQLTFEGQLAAERGQQRGGGMLGDQAPVRSRSATA